MHKCKHEFILMHGSTVNNNISYHGFCKRCHIYLDRIGYLDKFSVQHTNDIPRNYYKDIGKVYHA